MYFHEKLETFLKNRKREAEERPRSALREAKGSRQIAPKESKGGGANWGAWNDSGVIF